jgi:glycerate 2-kinase
MNVLIAPDKFKGTLKASEVCDAIEAGLKENNAGLSITKFPLADGGDGTLDILLAHHQGTRIELEVNNPIFKKINASYGISADGNMAFIEMAQASGLALLKESQRSILNASTYGTGELIGDALDRGVKQIVLGIGGSATNDAALGAAQALSYRFLDAKREIIAPIGRNLSAVQTIDDRQVHPRLKDVSMIAICDVTNPFYGMSGAAHVYAAQKGATENEVILLDKGLQHIAMVFQTHFKIDVQTVSGAGAGGGFAGGAMVLFNASLQSGIETLFDFTGFEQAVREADVVITGEGKIDSQTLDGKLVAGIARLAKKHRKKLIGIVGQSDLTDAEAKSLGFESVHTLLSFAESESKAKTEAGDVLQAICKTLLLTS